MWGWDGMAGGGEEGGRVALIVVLGEVSGVGCADSVSSADSVDSVDGVDGVDSDSSGSVAVVAVVLVVLVVLPVVARWWMIPLQSLGIKDS